jgi:hypothetical protein
MRYARCNNIRGGGAQSVLIMNIIKMVLFLLAGAIVMLIVAAVYFGGVFLMIDGLNGATIDNEAGASFGNRLSYLASIAGICVGLGLGLTAGHERLRRNGKPDYPALVIGWALAIPVFALFLYAGTGGAIDLVLAHKTLGVLSVILYGAFVGWIGNKIAKPAAS